MDGVLPLPIDVCEHVIDLCDFRVSTEANPEENYETLRACALVCSAWFPRSRHNLLRDVRLYSLKHVSLLLRLLSDQPHLSELVTTVHMLGTEYVPFAWLSHLLKNCRYLSINPDDWSRLYPPGYYKFIPDFRTLVTLLLGVTGLSAPEIFKIIWSLPRLLSLTLLDGRSLRLEQFGAKYSERLAANCQLKSCSQLKRLAFRSDFFSTLLCTENFPPPGAFGQSVTHLDLSISQHIIISASFLACVGDFLQLASVQLLIQDPTVYDSPPDCNILSSTFQVLSHIRSGPRLRKVDLRLNPGVVTIPSSSRRFSYNLTRTAFLDILCGPQMRDALERFPSLDVFGLSLHENDVQYDTWWWNDRIVERLPTFRSVLEVALDGRDKTRAVEFLWDPEGLAKRLASLKH